MTIIYHRFRGKDKRIMKKTRKELRKDIAESANSLKSNIYLGMVLQVSELFRKSLDDKEYTELSDLQWKQRTAISDILRMRDAKKVSFIISLISGMGES